jgi:class 3 adenylate cyclase/tetratricopeptide (TPR) repeat protein
MTQPITLVFTDIVGSSAAKRAGTLGADASARDRAYLESIQTKHLRLIRGAVAEHNGTEIMTMGDGFFLTFADPVDGLRCAAAIQQRLSTHPIDTPSGPLQLRIGIHIGRPEYFENSWHGTDVDIAARTESAGAPDQILVTDAFRKAVGDPLGIKFRPLGIFSLRGVGDVKLWDADYDQQGLRRPSLRSNEQKRRGHLVFTSAAAVVLLALLCVGGWALWTHHQQAHLAKAVTGAAKDSIILADFDNKTGEPVFDTTLTQALAIQLEQSPVLNLVSQQHLRQSMKYLGKSSDDPLTPAVAREIGEREGVKAYLTGSIAKLGNDYVVTVTAQNTETGDDIASEQAQSSDKDHVLDALDTVATAMRRSLGESLSSIQKLDTPLGQATTPSLEAFRAYALGDVEHEKGLDIPKAEGHYRQAVDLDPNFAMAWARLGVVYINSGQRGKALECFTRAYHLSKNVSEREQLYIAGHYYQNALGDVQKTIETLDLATRTYPLNFDNYVNLSVAQLSVGQFDDSLANLRKAIAISPDDAIAQADIVSGLISIDRFPEALSTLATMNRLDIADGSQTVVNLYQLGFLTGDHGSMQQAVSRMQGRVDEFSMSQTVAFAQEFEGRYREAKDSWNRAASQAASQQAPDVEANSILQGVSGRALANIEEDCSGDVNSALAKDKSKQTLVLAAFTAALCNDTRTATPLLSSLTKAYPSDTLITQVSVPQSRAALALAAHKPAEALHELEESQPYDFVSPGAYLRGLAYLDLHDGANAVAAFKSATRYRGAALQCCQDYPQAQLGLARAYAMTGNKDAAKKAYQDVFATWKNANPDLPQLVTAKKELAALQ